MVPIFLVVTLGSYFDCNANKPLKVPYCALFKSDRFNEKLIVTKATLLVPSRNNPQVDGGDSLFFSRECNNRDYFGLASFGNTKSEDLLKKSSQTASGKSQGVFEVEFEAKLIIYILPSFGHLDSFRAKFEVISIRSIRHLKEESVLPKLNEPAPILESAASLKASNLELMMGLFGKSNAESDENFFQDTSASYNDKKVSIQALVEILRAKQFEKLVLRTKKLSKQGNVWEIEGTIEKDLKGTGIDCLRFSNLFILADDQSWKLIGLDVAEF